MYENYNTIRANAVNQFNHWFRRRSLFRLLFLEKQSIAVSSLQYICCTLNFWIMFKATWLSPEPLTHNSSVDELVKIILNHRSSPSLSTLFFRSLLNGGPPRSSLLFIRFALVRRFWPWFLSSIILYYISYWALQALPLIISH